MSDNEIFAKAANILSDGGHCKFALEDTDGAHCAVGALSVAATGRLMCQGKEEYVALEDTLRRLVARAEAKLGRDIVTWNNAPERTGEDVILLFKELAHE